MAKVKDFNYFSRKKYDGMLGRCYRETDRSYKNYGARGIRVCAAWIKDINAFRAWLLQALTAIDVSVESFCKNAKAYQLDRTDTDGHYIPTNCRLVNPQANMRNRRGSLKRTIVSAEGEEIQL